MGKCTSCGFDNESKESNCLKCGYYLRKDPHLGESHRLLFVAGFLSIMIGFVIAFSSSISMLIGDLDKTVIRFLLPIAFGLGLILIIAGSLQKRASN